MEEWYRKRVNENDIRIAKAQLWPNIGIDMNVNYDSNTYLYNNYWAAVGVRVSLNLFRLLQLPALNEQAADMRWRIGQHEQRRRAAAEEMQTSQSELAGLDADIEPADPPSADAAACGSPPGLRSPPPGRTPRRPAPPPRAGRC